MPLQTFSFPLPETRFIKAGNFIYKFKLRGGSSYRQGRHCCLRHTASYSHSVPILPSSNVLRFGESKTRLCLKTAQAGCFTSGWPRKPVTDEIVYRPKAKLEIGWSGSSGDGNWILWPVSVIAPQTGITMFQCSTGNDPTWPEVI